jgi:hypothetical protein
MEAIERGVSRIGEIKVMNIPVGQAILLLAGLGINDALVPVVTNFLKFPALSGAALSIVTKLPFVSRFLGPTLSDVLSATAITVGIDEQFAIRRRVKNLVSGLTSRVGVRTSGVELEGTPSTPSRVSLGQDFGPISEQERRILATFQVTP